METYASKPVETHTGAGSAAYAQQPPQGSEYLPDPAVASKKQLLIAAFADLIEAMLKAARPADPMVAPTPSATGPAGDQPGTGQPATIPVLYPPSPTKGSGTNGGGNGESAEAFKVPVAVLQESYRQDRAREMARRSESGPKVGTTGMGDGRGLNKHVSDSNKAPLRAIPEFGPSYGRRGKSTKPTMEVAAARHHVGARPETAPSAPVVRVPIDAYWASFGTAVERAQERARMAAKKTDEAQMMHLESIIGSDDRIRVANTQEYPFSCVCSLLIKAQTGNYFIGTGWLVGPRLVLTAGHCVYMADEGGWAAEIEVMPGRDGDNMPFGSVVARDFRSVNGWTIDGNRDYDYGAILLPEDRRLGDELGWFGYAPRTDEYLRSVTLNIAGYPGDGGPDQIDGTQWFMSRGVMDVNEKQISYDIDTYGGNSGGPVYEMTADGSRYGLAIHTWGTDVANGATRITQEVFNNIVLWAGQVP